MHPDEISSKIAHELFLRKNELMPAKLGNCCPRRFQPFWQWIFMTGCQPQKVFEHARTAIGSREQPVNSPQLNQVKPITLYNAGFIISEASLAFLSRLFYNFLAQTLSPFVRLIL